VTAPVGASPGTSARRNPHFQPNAAGSPEGGRAETLLFAAGSGRAQRRPPAEARRAAHPRPERQRRGNRIEDVGGLAEAPLLRLRTLVNLGMDETDPSRPVGVQELRAAGISVDGPA
jgi:hypothetical protein